MAVKYNGKRRSLPLGRALRDEGMASVLEHAGEWTEYFYVFVARQPYGHEVTGEDLRFAAIDLIGYPHDEHAWGAAINTCIRREFLHKTGRRTQMTDPRSHGRSTDIYITGWWKRFATEGGIR